MQIPPAAVYEARNPRASSLYALVEDYYEEFERVYGERHHEQYGPWRKVIGEVLRKYLDCGDLHCGFARLACGRCRYQTILAYSCKCRLYAERMNMLSTGASPLVSLWLFKALRSRPAQFTSHILSSQTTFLETSFTQFQGGCHAGVLHR